MTDETATCEMCGSKVPLDLLAEHLAEHDTTITANDVRAAPVVRIEDPDGED